jgi:hypothetical protein
MSRRARSHSTGAVAGEVPSKLERSWSRSATSASTCSLWSHQQRGTTWRSMKESRAPGSPQLRGDPPEGVSQEPAPALLGEQTANPALPSRAQRRLGERSARDNTTEPAWAPLQRSGRALEKSP